MNDSKEDLEKLAIKKIEHYLKDGKVFMDTCSFMDEHANDFVCHAVPILDKYNQKVFVPKKCVDEMIHHSHDKENEKKAKAAVNAIEILGKLQQRGFLDIRGEENDNFADNVFLTQFTKYRIKYSLVLITQDRKLGRDILALNNSESVNGKRIRVLRINKYGFLSKHEYDNQYWNKSNSLSEYNDDAHMQEEVPIDEKFPVSNHVTNISNEQLTITMIPSEDDDVIADGQKLKLVKELGVGGEGTIYETNTQYVAKIYKPEKITKRKFAKLRLMISKKIDVQGICYPISIIYNMNNEFVGYLMPRASGRELGKSIFIKPLFIKYFPDWKKKDTVRLCMTILKKIKYLNDRNIILGDINSANILVVSPNEVYFVDTDSYQVGEFPCPVGTIYYTAPEIQRKNFGSFLRSQGNENFAIATLLFMIMLPGKSPYAQQGGEDAIENIINMDFSYPFGDNSNKKTPDGLWRFIWSHLTYDLKEAFYNTFRKGGKYSEEYSRLNADAWLQLFNEYYKLLDSGKFGEQDKMSEELFPTRFKKNPYKEYATCKLCGEEEEKERLVEGICHNCLNQGEVYQCKRCGKDMIYNNYDKYIKKSPQYDICFKCKQELDQIYSKARCIECQKEFDITRREYEYYMAKGYKLPKRCPECRASRKKKKEGTDNIQNIYLSGLLRNFFY